MSEISVKSAKDSDKKIETIEYEIETDEKGNPIIPEGWTFLTHGSNLDKWDKSKLCHDFMVGNGIINGKEVSKLPLCCIERNDAKFNFERDGSNTAKAYGGKGRSFEIRVLFYKNPRTNLEEEIKKKLDPREVQDILKYYMYQDGRHPAIPTGTKLHFLKTGDFDEITNTNGNLILWYVPDQYLTQYLGDVQRSKEDKRKTRQQSNIDIQNDQELNSSTQNEKNSEEIRGLTNEDVEREIDENYEDSIPNNYLEAYLSDRISQVYSDRLKEIGVFETKGEKGFDLSPFLNDKLYYFNELSPSQAYRKITEELESYLEFVDKYKNIGDEVVSTDDRQLMSQTQRKIKSEEISSTRQESTLGQINGNSGDSKKSVPKEDKIKATGPQKSTTEDKKTLFDRFGDGLDNWLTGMEKFEKKMNYVTDKIAENGDRIIKNSFELLLLSYRINPVFIKNLELAIKSVNPNKLLKMDAILGKTKEKTKGEKKNDEFEQGR